MKRRGTWFCLAAASLLGGCGDSLVGGQCAAGYLEKDGACVAPAGPDAAGWYQSGGAGGGADVGGSGNAGAGESGGSGPTGGAGQGAAGQGGSGQGGGTQCDPPLVACSDGCVDTQTDPSNCGGCGVVCASEICVAGQCEGATAGHLVVIGMDYKSVGFDSPAAILLGNGVFMAAHEPVRIASFRQWASDASPNKVKAIVDDEAAARSRTVTWSQELTADDVPGELASGAFDVLIVNHQGNAPAGTLGSVGAAWAPAIQAFGQNGGVVVTLAVAGGDNEMPAFLTASGILQTSALTDVSAKPLYNQGFLDALGQNVLSPFLGKSATASLTTAESPSAELSMVIVTGSGAPVAVHKIISPN